MLTILNHYHPRTTTRSPMSVEISPKAFILVAGGQAWQGLCFLLKKPS